MRITASLLMLTAPVLLVAAETVELAPFYIQASAVANTTPATTFAAPVSTLSYDPRVDLQARGFAEAQSDVTIRGGTFEATGFQVGGLHLLDPQTGHYFGELPFDPAMLQPMELFTGVENAVYGHNSNVATLRYGWSVLDTGGLISGGVGTDGLNTQRLLAGYAQPWGGSRLTWGAEVGYSRSEGKGTLVNSDHDFERYSGRLQLRGERFQTDLFAGYVDKFYAWPGMYTADVYADRSWLATPPYAWETEDYEVWVTGLNHRQRYGEASFVEVAAGYRQLVDNYNFTRHETEPQFQHKTEAWLYALRGTHGFNEALSLDWQGSWMQDALVYSTNLTQVPFTSRDYRKAAALLHYQLGLADEQTLTLSAGGSVVGSDRHDTRYNPLARVAWEGNAGVWQHLLFAEFAQTRQLSGYTALNGGGGLFRGRSELDWETAQTWEMGYRLQGGQAYLEMSVFYREDSDLTDWVYDPSPGGSTARNAESLDMDTLGAEVMVHYGWEAFEITLGYSWLDKSSAELERRQRSSFYAFNYAEHRGTLAFVWRPISSLELRSDSELRQQEENRLRKSDDTAFTTAASIIWMPPFAERLELSLIGDNLTDSNFQDLPGTPASRRQLLLQALYRW